MLTAMLEKIWWTSPPSAVAMLLSPMSWLFGRIVSLRRTLYRGGTFKRFHPGVPVVVVGNIVIGGAGKTPITQAVVRCLIQAGYKPGVICRGYPVSPSIPRHVSARSRASEVGDEPLLHFALSVPVVVCAKRALAASALLDRHPEVDVLVADDALQHYALMRDVEIEVMSSERRYGNQMLLPAGPLREPTERARECGLRITPSWWVPETGYKVGNHHVARRRISDAYALIEPSRRTQLGTFAGSRPAVVAGIANPGQFAKALERAGVDGQLFAFSDHHAFKQADFDNIGNRSILMTEKDAAKCREFADHRMWVVPMTVHLAPETKRKLLHLVKRAREKYLISEPTSNGSETT
ncbi:MAG TPA: tetraacyldisaccharide 4'-kinase [Casimicrobium sp.]|nr:tetraacyldisaccharide 4'-kinase [Casimicrobium sp.]